METIQKNSFLDFLADCKTIDVSELRPDRLDKLFQTGTTGNYILNELIDYYDQMYKPSKYNILADHQLLTVRGMVVDLIYHIASSNLKIT